MANVIKIKQSAVANKVPTTAQLALGELAVNTWDGKLYTKKNNGTDAIVEIGPTLPAWGSITGTLSSQTDLQSALDAKQDVDADLTAIATLATTGTLRRTGTNTWALASETGSGNAVYATAPALSAPTFSTAATVTAGTNAQGQGALTSDINIITTAASNPSGVTLPTATAGRHVKIVNKGANAINVYPATGGSIDALAANASIQIAVNGEMLFWAASATLWYSSVNSVVNVALATGTLPVARGGSGQTTTCASLTVANAFTGAGAISVNGTGTIGYGTGSGGSVTQLTSKTTGVTLNKVCGSIATHNAALAAGAVASFQVTNSFLASTDIVVVTLTGGGATGMQAYNLWCQAGQTGAFTVFLRNISAGSLSESISFNFAVIKSVVA